VRLAKLQVKPHPGYAITRVGPYLHLFFWRTGKRYRISLGTTDQAVAKERAQALYSELTAFAEPRISFATILRIGKRIRASEHPRLD
jgi:hypothetical protein